MRGLAPMDEVDGEGKGAAPGAMPPEQASRTLGGGDSENLLDSGHLSAHKTLCASEQT